MAAVTKENLEQAGFAYMQFQRWAIGVTTETGKSTIIYDEPSNTLYAHGAPIATIESAEHLQEVVAALRAKPLDV